MMIRGKENILREGDYTGDDAGRSGESNTRRITLEGGEIFVGRNDTGGGGIILDGGDSGEGRRFSLRE